MKKINLSRWHVFILAFIVCLVFFMIGDSKNEVLETQNNGASMCMACIGLE